MVCESGLLLASAERRLALAKLLTAQLPLLFLATREFLSAERDRPVGKIRHGLALASIHTIKRAIAGLRSDRQTSIGQILRQPLPGLLEAWVHQSLLPVKCGVLDSLALTGKVALSRNPLKARRVEPGIPSLNIAGIIPNRRKP